MLLQCRRLSPDGNASDGDAPIEAPDESLFGDPAEIETPVEDAVVPETAPAEDAAANAEGERGVMLLNAASARIIPVGKDVVHILKNISLEIDDGDYLCHHGTLRLRQNNAYEYYRLSDTPTSGTYVLAGEDVSSASDDRFHDIRNQMIGFVFQSFYLLPKLTALDNVALPLLYANVPRRERRERAAEALASVGLEDRMDFYPNQLSGGQCQRVAIARAMIAKPRILLADEPTGALDSASGRQVMQIFGELNAKGTTVVLITHAQDIADCAKKIHRILDGELIRGDEDKHRYDIMKGGAADEKGEDIVF